ncbi:MAG: di-trans,poly-cis-decaprenylcistransferase [Clostridia bacterium]|nr:di-trans,poly-cis-decaprenylcistransferase [Clostridia bacterium]
MDGNGRWAKARLMPRSFGHKKGMERMIDLVEHAFDRGVKTITVYALSTENLFRPQEEVDALFGLFRSYFSKYAKKLIEKRCRLTVLGDVKALPDDVQALIADAEKESEKFEEHRVNIALNYGARAEIARAVNQAITAGKPITEAEFSDLLYTAGQGDVDLIIRTGKEKRLSNFLLWQAAYAELYFSDKMFPDFTNENFDEALADYAARTRRFGKV